MSLPQRVQEQADAAARHYQQHGNPDVIDDQASVEKSAPEPLQGDDNGQDSGEGEEPEGEQRQAEHQPKAENEQHGAAYWQHRFNVEAGRLRTATDENRTLKETLKAREDRIAELERSGGQSSGNLTPQEVTNLDQLKEEYGSDLIGAIQSMIENKLPKTEGKDDRVERIEQRLQQDEQEKQDDLEAKFWQRLQQRVPKLQEINADQGFLNWLSGIDRFSGKPRQELLNDARQQLDPERVADIFDAYSNSAQPSTQSGGAKPEKREIPEDQVQPRQTRSTSTPNDAKVWSRDEISQFYKDRQRGRYSKDEGERIEADIFAAQQQGRVR